jgi:hypothetical protein
LKGCFEFLKRQHKNQVGERNEEKKKEVVSAKLKDHWPHVSAHHRENVETI